MDNSVLRRAEIVTRLYRLSLRFNVFLLYYNRLYFLQSHYSIRLVVYFRRKNFFYWSWNLSHSKVRQLLCRRRLFLNKSVTTTQCNRLFFTIGLIWWIYKSYFLISMIYISVLCFCLELILPLFKECFLIAFCQFENIVVYATIVMHWQR